MSSSPQSGAIRLSDVRKSFLIYDRPEDRLRQMFLPRLARAFGRAPKQYFREFPAVGGVSLEVGRGETVGIIGRNGSGKSTLLQMICGTLQPTSGSIEVQGRIAALLELGAGFNPEFTGRENVYMNAAILGLSTEEVDARFDQIASFADIGLFMDQPVKIYSSGMYIRLAFAVAINVDPAILIIDEALAVGDEAFQRKCFSRIEKIKENGATVLFVSHSAQAVVQLCDRAVLMENGQNILEGRPKLVVTQYQKLVNADSASVEIRREEIRAIARSLGSHSHHPNSQVDEKDAADASGLFRAVEREESFDAGLLSRSVVRYAPNGARIDDVRLETLDGRVVNVLTSQRVYRLRYDIVFEQQCRDISFGFMIKNVMGYEISGAATTSEPTMAVPKVIAGQVLSAEIEFECLFTPGTYFFNVGVIGNDGQYLDRIMDVLMFRVQPQSPLLATGQVDVVRGLRLRDQDESDLIKVTL